MNGGRGRGWTEVVKCDVTCVKNKHQGELLASLPSLQGTSLIDGKRQQLLSGDRQP
jgi:hypothetical protein